MSFRCNRRREASGVVDTGPEGMMLSGEVDAGRGKKR